MHDKKVCMVDNCKVTLYHFVDMTEDEIRKYIFEVERRNGSYVKEITLSPSNEIEGGVKVDYELENIVPFERIRRITGYLTGALTTWNNAKRAEEKDRVKHGIKDFEGE